MFVFQKKDQFCQAFRMCASFFKIEEGDFEEIVVIKKLPEVLEGVDENIKQQQQQDSLEPMRYISFQIQVGFHLQLIYVLTQCLRSLISSGLRPVGDMKKQLHHQNPCPPRLQKQQLQLSQKNHQNPCPPRHQKQRQPSRPKDVLAQGIILFRQPPQHCLRRMKYSIFK